jgi:hypothetical protein
MLRTGLFAAVFFGSAMFGTAMAQPIDVNDVIDACHRTAGCVEYVSDDGDHVVGSSPGGDFVCTRGNGGHECEYFPKKKKGS